MDPGLNLPGTLLDGDPSWNMKVLMPVRVSTEPTPLMSSSEIRDQVMLRTDRFIIDELINGLMTDPKAWIILRQSSCDQFGRPFELELFHDIPTDQRIPYPLSLDRFMFSFNGSFMGLVGQVNIVDGRSVTFKFTGDGAFVTPDTLGYVRDTFALGAKICNLVSLFAGEMFIV